MSSLLCLTTSYPEPALPHAGHFVQRLNRIYQEEGWSPDVIALKRTIEEERSLSGDDRIGGHIRWVKAWGQKWIGGIPDQLSQGKLNTWATSLAHALLLRRAYRQYIRQAQVGVPVVSHWALPCGLISMDHAPLVYCHGGDVALFETLRSGPWMARRLTQRAGLIVCVSEDLRHRWLAMCGPQLRRSRGDRIRALPMGIDEPQPCLRARDRFINLIDGRLCLSTVGRFVPIKGYDLLCEAIGALSEEERNQIIWLAAGTGPQLSEVISQAKRLKVPLVHLGELEPSQRDALLSVTSLFVAPSRRIGKRVEGSPLALREAILSGCRVLASPLGGVEELGRGLPIERFLITSPEVIPLRDQLHGWISSGVSPHTELNNEHARSISCRAGEKWTWRTLGPQHVSLLEQVIQQERLVQPSRP